MRKIIRVLFLLSPIIILGFALYEMDLWHPPLNSDVPQYIDINVLRDHPDIYKAPMRVIIQGQVYNKTGDLLFLYGGDRGFFLVNCSGLDISSVEPGMDLYFFGLSYIDDPLKGYFLAENFWIQYSYSVYLSIPGAFLILIILFVGFKFNLKDFSFSRKRQEEPKDA
jgi:hypothetical protein